jgi:hypothetical protein
MCVCDSKFKTPGSIFMKFGINFMPSETWGNLRKRDHLEDLGIKGNWIFKTLDEGHGLA